MTKRTLNRLGAISIALATGLTIFTSYRAHADLVLDDDAVGKEEAADERESTRKVIKKSRTVETTQEVASESGEEESDERSMAPSQKSELVRRKRMREEMKNEDLLQQRLEELRLRDEERRTKKVLRNTELDEEEESAREKAKKLEAKKDERSADADIVIEEEVIYAPVNEAKQNPSYYMSPAPTTDHVQTRQSSRDADLSPAPTAGSRSAPAATSSSSVRSASLGKSSGVSIAPRFGFSSISNDQFEFSPKFSAGLGLGFDVSENVAIEFGYTYSDVGIRYQNSYGSPYYANYSGAADELSFRQHIFDATMKLYFLDTSSRVRPFVGAGMGYSMGTLNYSERVQQINRAYGANTQDYELKSFLGILSAGLDIKVADNVSIGGGYRFLKPLSSSEEESLNTGAFYSQSYDYTRDYVRSSLKDSNIHMFHLGASFQF